MPRFFMPRFFMPWWNQLGRRRITPWIEFVVAVHADTYGMIAKHNSTGGDRFRLGSIVPGEAGRESKVNSLMSLGNQ
jgi:hypothetical protein